jgi:hypothetical protein
VPHHRAWLTSSRRQSRRRCRWLWCRWRSSSASGGGVGVGVDAGTAVDFPSLTDVPLDRTKEVGEVWRRSTSWSEPWPPPSICSLCDGGPPALCGWAPPDQGVVKESELAVGPIRLRSILTFYLLISTYHLNFRLNLYILISFTIPSQVSA